MSTNYSKLVFTAGLALFVVRWEPAPFDICILLLALALATRLPSRKVRSWVAEMPLAAFYLYGYVFFSILSLLFSTHVRSACLYLGITVYLVFAYLVLVSTLNNDRVARQALSHGYILATLISAVLGVLAIRLNHIYDFDILLYGGARAQGLFKDPNVYGPFLVPSILAMVSRIFVIDNPAFSCGCLIPFGVCTHLFLFERSVAKSCSRYVRMAFSRFSNSACETETSSRAIAVADADSMYLCQLFRCKLPNPTLGFPGLRCGSFWYPSIGHQVSDTKYPGNRMKN